MDDPPMRCPDASVACFWRILFGILLVVASHQSLVPQPADVFESLADKLLHVLGWGVLSFSLYLASRPSPHYGGCVTALFGYSVCIELGQLLSPGRHFSWLDIVANGLGCALVYGGIKIYRCLRID